MIHQFQTLGLIKAMFLILHLYYESVLKVVQADLIH